MQTSQETVDFKYEQIQRSQISINATEFLYAESD